MIVGADGFPYIFESYTMVIDGLFSKKSKFGWIISEIVCRKITNKVIPVITTINLGDLAVQGRGLTQRHRGRAVRVAFNTLQL